MIQTVSAEPSAAGQNVLGSWPWTVRWTSKMATNGGNFIQPLAFCNGSDQASVLLPIDLRCQRIIRRLILVVRRIPVRGIFDPTLRRLPFRRVLTVLEDHLRVGIQEGQTVPPFVVLGVLNEGRRELRPVA